VFGHLRFLVRSLAVRSLASPAVGNLPMLHMWPLARAAPLQVGGDIDVADPDQPDHGRCDEALCRRNSRSRTPSFSPPPWLPEFVSGDLCWTPTHN